jgi:AraC-like DNA-binding protein
MGSMFVTPGPEFTCGFAVGFGSLSHFVTTFGRRYGVRPSDVGRSVTS